MIPFMEFFKGFRRIKYTIVNGKKSVSVRRKILTDLPWERLETDVVIESTGHFLDKESPGETPFGRSKKVIISAPAKDNTQISCDGCE